MRLQRGVDATAALQGARHKVFVEGSDDEAIDPVVIGELLKRNGLPQVEVAAMGACDNVRSAAQALYRHHPSYYFVIDRDDQGQEAVERSWSNFPDPNTHNMLIWRKRELENYFIDPEYAKNSSFLHVSEEDLREYIRQECNRRLFMDAANLTLRWLHREANRSFAENFRNPDLFSSEAEGASRLQALAAIASKRQTVCELLAADAVERSYAGFVAELSGGILPLQYGNGTWLERMSGKEIFRHIAGSCFRVTDARGDILQGERQHKEIARDLLARDLDGQPADFRQLLELLRARARA